MSHHRRKMTWVLWIWVALTVLFIVLVNTVKAQPCNEPTEAGQAGCQLGTQMAPAVWTGIGLVIGFMGFVALSLIWFMTRPKQQRIVYAPTTWAPPLPPPT